MFKVEALDVFGIPVKKSEVDTAQRAVSLSRRWYHERYVARVVISVPRLLRRGAKGSVAVLVTPLQEEGWKPVLSTQPSSYKRQKALEELYEDWLSHYKEQAPEPEKSTSPPVDRRQLRLFE